MIVKEAVQLVNNGFKEIVLCGICLGAYKDLTGLLERLGDIEALKRIRLSSIEPVYVNRDLVDKIFSSQKLCRHLHIPLQSGDDQILRAMNRSYTSGQFITLVNNVYKKIPNAAITTDVMVGFPGETDEAFNNTLRTLQAIKSMRTHIFTFSKREGTEAFYLKGEVQKDKKVVRSRIVKELAQEISFMYRKRFQGEVVEVLVENSPDKDTKLLNGYTDTYIKILFEGPNSIINELVKVKITEVTLNRTIGRIQ